jgi:hypothetical protein
MECNEHFYFSGNVTHRMHRENELENGISVNLETLKRNCYSSDPLEHFEGLNFIRRIENFLHAVPVK